MYCFLFYFCHLLCLKQVFLKIMQHSHENTCVRVGSLFVIDDDDDDDELFLWYG